MLVSVLRSKQCMIVWGLRQWRKDSSIIWRRGWRQMAHLRAWRSRGVGSGPLILGLWRGFGVGCGVSSSSARDDDGGEAPAEMTSATRESRRCCVSSLLGSGYVESRFPGSGLAERGGGGGGGAGSGAVDATFLDNSSGNSRFAGSSKTGIESGAAGGAGG